MTTNTPPPPLSSLSLRATGRLARIAAMDRGALHELLSETGALIDAALEARGVAPDERDAAITKLAQELWAEAALMSAPAPDERSFVLAHALGAVPVASLVDTELDAALVTHLCAGVAAGIATDAERRLCATQRADARVEEAAREIEAACTRARAVGVGAGRASALWSRIEPLLR